MTNAVVLRKAIQHIVRGGPSVPDIATMRANITQLFTQFVAQNYYLIQSIDDIEALAPVNAGVRQFPSNIYLDIAPGVTIDDSAASYPDWVLAENAVIEGYGPAFTTLGIGTIKSSAPGNVYIRNIAVQSDHPFQLVGCNVVLDSALIYAFGVNQGTAGSITDSSIVTIDGCEFALYATGLLIDGTVERVDITQTATLDGPFVVYTTNAALITVDKTAGGGLVNITGCTYGASSDPSMYFFEDVNADCIVNITTSYAPNTNSAGFIPSAMYTNNCTVTGCGYGLINTRPNGFLGVNANALVTVGSLTPVPVNAAFTLASTSQRFSEPSNGVLRYDDTKSATFLITAAGNVRRVSGASAVDVKFELQVNNVTKASGVVTISGSRLYSWASTPIPLLLNPTDEITVLVSQPATATNVVIEDMGITVS